MQLYHNLSESEISVVDRIRNFSFSLDFICQLYDVSVIIVFHQHKWQNLCIL